MTVRMRVLSASVALLLVAAGPRAQAPAPYTIDQILSAPFAASLVASPVGRKVAWVFNERGARNVWVAEAPAWAGRALTAYAGDNGQDITGLQWSGDGRHLVYVRGGGANRQGELPNPTSDPAGVQQSVWTVPASGGEPRRLGDGDAPAVAPRGDLVAFVQRGQIWLAGLGGAPAAAQAVKARGSARSLAWSPDGSALAFASARGTHAFIGIYRLDDKSLRFVDPSVDADGDPVWSPDGRSVAFVRRPVDRDELPFHPRREGEPWSIRIVDAASGEGRELWRAERGRGSVFQGVSGPSLVWTSEGSIVFPWERDGWKHLYAVPAAGGSATLLTPGAFEVEDVVASADGRGVVYNSNQGDIDRRDVWRVVPGGAPEALTRGDGIEWSAAPLAEGGGIAFLQADARRPGRPMLMESSGAPRELAPQAAPATFPAAALVEPEAVTFAAADGMQIPAQLFKPADAGSGRRPAVVFFHGGSRRQMLLGWHYMGYYHNTYAFNQYLASRGYIVLSVNYRSGTGYGLEFREALEYGANGASEYQDVVGAGLYLRARPDVDPDRIGLWGGSYGGYLTAMGLARAPHLFRAGVDLHGVHDWNVVIRNFAPGYDPMAREAVARRAFASSPMASLDAWRAPVLVVHGDDDRNVPFSETVDLVEQLRDRGVHVEQLIFPDEVHGFLLHERWAKTFRTAADFFDRHLRGGERTSQ